MTSMRWCATSAPKASTNATSPPHAAVLMGAGSAPRLSAQSVSGRQPILSQLSEIGPHPFSPSDEEPLQSLF